MRTLSQYPSLVAIAVVFASACARREENEVDHQWRTLMVMYCDIQLAVVTETIPPDAFHRFLADAFEKQPFKGETKPESRTICLVNPRLDIWTSREVAPGTLAIILVGQMATRRNRYLGVSFDGAIRELATEEYSGYADAWRHYEFAVPCERGTPVWRTIGD